MIFTDLFENTNQPQGVSEGHADQQRTIVKRNGQPVGEVGIDRESSPGVGQYYMKHYASGTDNSGYHSREEALDDLRHIMKQSVYGELQGQGVEEGTDVTDYNPKSKGGTRKELIAKYHKTKNPKDAEAARKAGATQKELQGIAEAMKPSDIPPSMRKRLTMRDIEAERPQGAYRFRVTFPDGHVNDYMTFDAAKSAADLEKGRISKLSEERKGTSARVERILKMLRARHPQAENDLEALIFDFRGQQAQDRTDIARLDAENDMEEADIERLEKMLNLVRRRRGASAVEPAMATESLRDGEFHIATVTLDDGTKKKVRITSDEGFRDQIQQHFAKQGRKVQDIDVDYAVRLDLGEAKKKPQPTNPELWGRAKAAARSKFDVYPSAYANAWAAKWYKSKGGGWRMGKPKKD